jgi:NAD(P)-dependent dehydrogenase (short-subunit alcohol dehydrogenase family)
VLALTDHLVAGGWGLDILINNAAQTVWRPAAYYADWLAGESISERLAPEAESLLASASGGHAPPLSQAPGPDPGALAAALTSPFFPRGRRDEEGQPLDLRERNSWVLELEEVDVTELVEVHAVNTFSPFLLVSRLRPLLLASRFSDRYVVNVSAMEGQFSRQLKTSCHPHTNMAKAALNMLTRTSARSWAAEGIYMNSVDTGWVTQENPRPVRTRLRTGGFVPPLDVIDGAARIYAPIADGVNGHPIWGRFLKDYAPYDW